MCKEADIRRAASIYKEKGANAYLFILNPTQTMAPGTALRPN
jgi:hypothetical protein